VERGEQLGCGQGQRVADVRRGGGLGGGGGGQGADQLVAGFFNLVGDFVGALEIVQAPVLALLGDAHEATAEQLDVQVVGLIALGQAGGFEHHPRAGLEGPEQGQARGASRPLATDDLSAFELDVGAYGNPVTADQVSPGQIHGRSGLAIAINGEAEHERLSGKIV
jgi:hypothetical protein